ncbi:hypothetical protein [Thermococcus sp.]
MIIPFTYTIPANTKSEVKIDEIEVPPGILTQIKIHIPHWKLTAGIRFETEDGRKIPVPSNTEKYFTGDNSSLEFTRTLLLFQSPGRLKVYAVNYDNYAHVVNGYIEVITFEEIALLKYLNGGK